MPKFTPTNPVTGFSAGAISTVQTHDAGYGNVVHSDGIALYGNGHDAFVFGQGDVSVTSDENGDARIYKGAKYVLGVGDILDSRLKENYSVGGNMYWHDGENAISWNYGGSLFSFDGKIYGAGVAIEAACIYNSKAIIYNDGEFFLNDLKTPVGGRIPDGNNFYFSFGWLYIGFLDNKTLIKVFRGYDYVIKFFIIKIKIKDGLIEASEEECIHTLGVPNSAINEYDDIGRNLGTSYNKFITIHFINAHLNNLYVFYSERDGFLSVKRHIQSNITDNFYKEIFSKDGEISMRLSTIFETSSEYTVVSLSAPGAVDSGLANATGTLITEYHYTNKTFFYEGCAFTDTYYVQVNNGIDLSGSSYADIKFKLIINGKIEINNVGNNIAFNIDFSIAYTDKRAFVAYKPHSQDCSIYTFKINSNDKTVKKFWNNASYPQLTVTNTP